MLKISIAAVGLFALAGYVAATPASAASVMKQCGTEWKAAKAANTTNGQTWSDYLKDCKARHASDAATVTPAAATAAPAPAPAPAATPAAAPAPAKPKPTQMAKVSATATGAGQFASEGEAKGHCPTDTVVWVNTKSHKYHYAGHRSYGTTKQGAYMCEADAKAGGEAAAKGEKPKS